MDKAGKVLGLLDIMPVMGSFPLQHSQGMGFSFVILYRSLDKGRYQHIF